MKLKILQVAHHRNGIGGEGFYAVKFLHGRRLMAAAVFEDAGRVAVFQVDLLSGDEGVGFGDNSWSADAFEPTLREAVARYERDRTPLGLDANAVCEPSAEDFAICPACRKRGGLLIRVDSWVNYPIPAHGSVNWDDESNVTTFDARDYECTECGAELSQTEIEEANDFCIV